MLESRKLRRTGCEERMATERTPCRLNQRVGERYMLVWACDTKVSFGYPDPIPLIRLKLSMQISALSHSMKGSNRVTPPLHIIIISRGGMICYPYQQPIGPSQ